MSTFLNLVPTELFLLIHSYANQIYVFCVNLVLIGLAYIFDLRVIGSISTFFIHLQTGQCLTFWLSYQPDIRESSQQNSELNMLKVDES